MPCVFGSKCLYNFFMKERCDSMVELQRKIQGALESEFERKFHFAFLANYHKSNDRLFGTAAMTKGLSYQASPSIPQHCRD